MIIYEVNLTIQKEIYPAFYAWLETHMQQMLTFEGFKQAEIGMIENPLSEQYQQLRISYLINSIADLEKYLADFAPSMRKEGLHKFPNQFTATRRIVKLENVIVRDPVL